MPDEPTLRYDPDLAPGYWTPARSDFLRTPAFSPQAKLLYLILCSYAGQGVTAWPGRERLASELPCDSLRTVDKYLGELVAAGLVEVQRRGLTLTNLYTVHKLPTLADAQSLHVKMRNRRAPKGATIAHKVESAQQESGEGTPPQIQAPSIDEVQARYLAGAYRPVGPG